MSSLLFHFWFVHNTCAEQRWYQHVGKHVAKSLNCSLLPLVHETKDDVEKVYLSITRFYFR